MRLQIANALLTLAESLKTMSKLPDFARRQTEVCQRTRLHTISDKPFYRFFAVERFANTVGNNGNSASSGRIGV